MGGEAGDVGDLRTGRRDAEDESEMILCGRRQRLVDESEMMTDGDFDGSGTEMTARRRLESDEIGPFLPVGQKEVVYTLRQRP